MYCKASTCSPSSLISFVGELANHHLVELLLILIDTWRKKKANKLLTFECYFIFYLLLSILLLRSAAYYLQQGFSNASHPGTLLNARLILWITYEDRFFSDNNYLVKYSAHYLRVQLRFSYLELIVLELSADRRP